MQTPPFDDFLGVRVVRHDAGEAEVCLELEPHHLNRRGVAHGGVVASLLDSALGAAVISAMPEQWWCATTSLSMQFVEGARGDRLTATGRVVRRGVKVAFASGEARDADDRIVATAQGTWHLWSCKPGSERSADLHRVAMRDTNERFRVGKILAVGRNYSEHVAEMGAPAGGPPVVFLKPTSALVGPGATVRIPGDAGEVHHEVELVVLIGTSGRAIPEDRALEHVAGYGVGLDLTLRELQQQAKSRGEPWALAKGFDGSAPVSRIAPRDEVGDVSGLEISLEINGRRVQHANTGQMIRGVDTLLSHVSRHMTLERGDLLFTGTPAGVGPVKAGDRLVARLEKVGSLEIAIETEPRRGGHVS